MKTSNAQQLINNLFTVLILLLFLPACKQMNSKINPKVENIKGYDEPAQAALFQKLRTHDPATGEVPVDKMWNAVMQTKQIKDDLLRTQNFTAALTWNERGSNSDAVGPSNGNTRANSGVTSGRIDAIWVDLADATGKAVWVGGRCGGLWKTTDITVSPANWVPVNDYMVNLSIAAITQDPTDHNIMYMCTGESFFEARSLRGNGVFKSTDHGLTWSQLSSTNNASYYYCTRILCDFQGNIYVGTQAGLFRSTKASGGAAWVNITPSAVASAVSDLEISSTTVAGRLHVINGVVGSLTSRYTDIPATVAAGTWTSPVTTIPSTSIRAEIAVSGNTLYCLPSDAGGQTPTVYKSTDGGANWATAGSTPLTVTNDPFANTQGWYNLTVAINPANANQCIIGGIDNAKTTNGGTTWTRISDWVFTTGQYVHADQHASVWYDGGNKLLFGCDGGIHYSADGGTTIRDRNVGLRLKQFYSVAAHPTLTNHFLTGAQDNGTHQFNNAGLSSSIEVFGGDGAYVAIDQDQPQFQVGAYVFSNYRRTTNTGATWIFQSPDDNNGLFINPYDYDNTNNRVYACYTPGNYLRWSNPQSGFTFTSVPVAAFGGQYVGAVAVSPFTANRVYFGMASGGKIIRVDGAEGASPSATDITGAGMPSGSVFMNCINTGSSDQFLVATYSNYGTNNIWVSTNGGTSWTNIDGNLPDMPVYWATFHPDSNSKMFIATETGVWETDLVNGASTVWTANTTFPTARATMLKYRSADRTLAASSYGRGLWTSVIPSVTTPDIQFQSATGSSAESTAATSGCRGYTDYTYNMQILNPPTGSGAATVTLGIAGGGTAIQGVDYDITTNGSFVAPSMNLSFGVGVTTSQPFTIRIYDDAAIESTESFTLNYSLSAGSTNAQAGSANQTMVYTITDNDAAPLASSGLSATIGTYNINVNQPFRGSFFDARTQMLYSASELTGLGLTAGNITSVGFTVVTKASTQPYSGFTIKLKNTLTAALGFGAFESGATTVYSGSYSTVSGLNTIPITSFYWDGTSNLLVEVCWDNTTASGNDDIRGSTSTANTFFDRQNTNVTPGCSISNGAFNFSISARPVITFNIATSGTPVSTALNSSRTAYLGPLDDAYFYDGSGNILARIRNLTAFDYGCTQIIIDRAGSTAEQFWNNAATNQLLSKSIKVIPTNNTSSGSYEITLYYTAAEVSGWETATGRTWAGSTMQVVKVSNGFFIPDVTPAVPHTADVAMVTGTKGTLGTNFTIRGAFSSAGFSGFGVGVPGNALLTSDFITKASGNFTDGTKWQYNNEGAGFIDALQAPSSNNNVTIQAAHTMALDAGFTINSGKTLTLNGTLNCGTNTISGAGSFVSAGASTLGIGSIAGITASGATGNIQTGTRTFAGAGNYTYNGAANQSAGNGLPAGINNLVITNTGGALNNIVSLGAALTVNGSSTLTSGILSIGSNTLTLNGAVSGSGTLTGTASGGLSTSNLVIGGSALNQTLNFTQTSAATRSLNNLTLSSGSSATLGNALDVYGTIALTSATLNLNAQNLTLKSNANNTARIANLTGSTLNGATNVTMERWIKLRAGGTGRAYRLLAPTVNTTGSINANWMEGGLNTAIGTNVNPVPLFGTQITGAGGNANGFDRTQTNQASLYSTTNAVTPTYTAIGSTSGTLNALTGYFMYIRGDRSMNMTLPLAVGMPTSSTTLRTTGTVLTGTKASFTNAFMGGAGTLNLVTNPYPSAIDWSLIQPACTNVATAYTFWDPNFGTRGGFVTVNTAGVASSGLGTQFIQTGQAFFVQSTGGVPTVSIQETHKVANNNNDVFLVPSVPAESFRTELYFTEPNGYRRIADGAIAVFGGNYNAGIDADDASEISNWDENIAIDRDGKHLAIESRPVIAKSDELPIFMSNMKKQVYEFEFTPQAFTNTSLKAELVDNFLGTRTLLSVTGPTSVSFTITDDPASAAANRFKVVFGAFGNPQGVDVITINASQVNNGVQVNWTSKTETDMLRYEVEKLTFGTGFTPANTIMALGNSSMPVNYNWIDTKPVNGSNYYRVKGIDKAGNIRYSDVVRVLFSRNEPAIVVYPNPWTGNSFLMDMYNLAKGVYVLNLYDNNGKLVYIERLQHDGSQATKTIKLKKDMAKGGYQLQLSGGNGFKTTKKMIKN